MNITLAQLNYHIGNFDYNYEKIKNAIELAKSEKSDLIIFSELAICGYSPLDMLKKKKFIEKCNQYLEKISLLTKDIAVIIGVPSYDNQGKLFNSAAFIEDGKIQQYFYKSVLSSHDIIEEHRYFESNTNINTITYKGKKIAISISDDIFNNQEEKESIYIEKISKLNPDICVNISASTYTNNKAEFRKDLLKAVSLKYSFPILNVNQVGANTELIYEGRSLVFNNGILIKECKYFKEEITTINTEEFSKTKQTEDRKTDRIANIFDSLVLGIKDYFAKNSFKKAVIGLSGGIDSAVTLAIAIEALGSENVTSILMPTKYSSDHSISDSLEMVKRTKSPYHIINIEKIRLSFLENLSEVFANCKENVAEENIQARIRGTLLMAYSNKFGNILLNTSNKSEFAVGYSTLYGDMNGALSVLGDVYKSDVFTLANYINEIRGNIIPTNIITKAPSAELRPDQKDQDSLPPYDILDKILYSYIEENLSVEEINYDKSLVEKVVKMINNNEFKRHQALPILRISSKAFGSGLRMPIVAKY